jgi:hypothetical protein
MTKCTCPGAFCSCSGTAVLKDGQRIHVSAMMRDSAPENPVGGRQSINDAQFQGVFVGGMPAGQYLSILDASTSRDAAARRDAYQDAYEDRISDAWRSGSQQPAAGFQIADSNGQAAYEQRVRDAWRA